LSLSKNFDLNDRHREQLAIACMALGCSIVRNGSLNVMPNPPDQSVHGMLNVAKLSVLAEHETLRAVQGDVAHG
jgi:hypothetical protein